MASSFSIGETEIEIESEAPIMLGDEVIVEHKMLKQLVSSWNFANISTYAQTKSVFHENLIEELKISAPEIITYLSG